MREQHAGNLGRHIGECLVGTGRAVSEVVHSGHGQGGRPAPHEDVAVGEERNARALEHGAHRRRPHPVVVIAEHGHHAVARAEQREHGREPVEVAPHVAHKIPTQRYEIGRELGDAVRRAREPGGRHHGAAVEIRDERDAVAVELARQPADRSGHLGRQQQPPVPVGQRRAQVLHHPADRHLHRALEGGRARLAAGRVTPGMEQRTDHRATTRETTSYMKWTPNVSASRLTRSSLPCTPRDSAWLSGNGDSP